MARLDDIAFLRVPSGVATARVNIGPRRGVNAVFERDGFRMLLWSDLFDNWFVGTGHASHVLRLPLVFRDGPYVVDAEQALDDLSTDPATFKFTFAGVAAGLFAPALGIEDLVVQGTNMTAGHVQGNEQFVFPEEDTVFTYSTNLGRNTTQAQTDEILAHLRPGRFGGVPLGIERAGASVFPPVPGIAERPIWVSVAGESADFSALAVEFDESVADTVAQRTVTMTAAYDAALDDLDNTVRWNGIVWQVVTTSRPVDTRFIELQLAAYAI